MLEGLSQSHCRLVCAVSRRGAAIDLRRPILVVSHGEFGARTRLELRQRGKRHHFAGVVAHVELSHVVQIRPVRRFRLHVHLPLAPETVKVVDEHPAHVGLDSSVDITDRHTLLQHFVPVDLHELLWHAGQKGSRDRANFGAFASGRQELVQVACQKRDVPSGAILQYEGKSSGRAHSWDRRRGETKSDSFGKRAELLIQTRPDFLILFCSGLAVVPGLQRNPKKGVITRPDKAEQVKTCNASGVPDAWRTGKDLLNLSRRC